MPSEKDVLAALRRFEKIFDEFPFADEADWAHALVLAVEPIVRDLIRGSTPLYGVTSPTQRDGQNPARSDCAGSWSWPGRAVTQNPTERGVGEAHHGGDDGGETGIRDRQRNSHRQLVVSRHSADRGDVVGRILGEKPRNQRPNLLYLGRDRKQPSVLARPCAPRRANSPRCKDGEARDAEGFRIEPSGRCASTSGGTDLVSVRTDPKLDRQRLPKTA